MDFGGVLTTDIWSAFAAFCESEGLAPDSVKDAFRSNPDALGLLRGLETGELDEAAFEPRFGAVLGIEDSEGLIGRLFAGLAPDEAMVGAVRAVRAAGVKTGLISNSWGLGIYDRAPIDLFDATVISGDVGLHKPNREIYELAAQRLRTDPGNCIFVDDLRENVIGAEAVGMTGILHRHAEQTIAALEDWLGLTLSAPA